MIQEKLRRRHATGTPIRVGWVGAGRMITGAICQTGLMKGMRNAVICDVRREAAIRAYEINGFTRADMVITNDPGIANDAIRSGKPVITESSSLMPQLEVDCVVEGTGVPEVGAVEQNGDYFTFYTPYHLVTNEIPLSIVWAVEDREPTVVPRHGLLTECLGAAKANFKAGTRLDGGGYTLYSVNDLACVARRENCVPFGLLDKATLLADVKRDQVITYDMVELKTDTLLYHLRKIQDAVIPPTNPDGI